MNNEELIQDYIANRLSEKEKAKVERLLETNSGFKTAFESHKDIAVAFKVSEADKLKTYFKQLEDNPVNSTSLFNKFKYVYLAVASIIAIGFFYNSFNTVSGNELFNSNFEIYPNTYQPVTRSNESSANNDAFVAYEKNDFITAERDFETLLKTSENPNIRFYYALSLLNQSKFDLALKQFEILDGKEYDYIEESLWFSALIQVKKENDIKAKEKLNQLKILKSAFKSEERKLLLQKLNNR
ncbi:tetratricopeptide repeat protein [Winogradskyella flava]|uniref:Tetratricopeptide repeat-containing protein n=1 Tax=Winogradskyella flava TaxID=1884876 RepID=A0A842IN48_9FLAO|nr:hypothetical protein [Winogradskyella flava]MBC2843639.1 hypothetical protein [Winogradskyella flava]